MSVDCKVVLNLFMGEFIGIEAVMNCQKSTQTIAIIYSYLRRLCCRCWYETGQRPTAKRGLWFLSTNLFFCLPECANRTYAGKMLIYAGLMKWAEFGRKNQQFESIITKGPPTPSMILFKAPSKTLPPKEAHSRGWEQCYGYCWLLLGHRRAVVGL